MLSSPFLVTSFMLLLSLWFPRLSSVFCSSNSLAEARVSSFVVG